MEVKICPKHPEANGARTKDGKSCLECKRKRDRDAIRAKRKYDPEFKAMDFKRTSDRAKARKLEKEVAALLGLNE